MLNVCKLLSSVDLNFVEKQERVIIKIIGFQKRKVNMIGIEKLLSNNNGL